jgi:hypothetical protein
MLQGVVPMRNGCIANAWQTLCRPRLKLIASRFRRKKEKVLV